MNTFKSLVSVVSFGFLALTALPAQAAIVLSQASIWEYTFTDPTGSGDWNTTVGGGWSTGQAPFSNVSSGDFAYNTYWPLSTTYGDDLWVRKSVDFTGFDLNSVAWDLGVDNGFKLFVNGTLIASDNAEGFTNYWEYSGLVAAALLNPGANIIAVALEDHGGLTAFDMQMTADLAAVPLPAALPMLASGIGLIGFMGMRRKRSKTGTA